jgi:hypothetical protein
MASSRAAAASSSRLLLLLALCALALAPAAVLAQTCATAFAFSGNTTAKCFQALNTARST